MKTLLSIIEHTDPLRELILLASKYMKPDEYVYVRYFPRLFGSIQVRAKRKRPFDWFGFAKVMKLTGSKISDQEELDIIIMIKRATHRLDSGKT